MNIELDIPLGQWRHLTSEELAAINGLMVHSSKTVDYDSEEMD
jgi:23S rRNA pseudouridine2604 synthase